jgi:lysozyme
MTPETMEFVRKNTLRQLENADPTWERGIDVSKWQGSIDWLRVALAGIKFAGIKATQGERIVDRDFVVDYRLAYQAGIRRTPYLFYEPDGDPKKQFDLFVKTVELAGGFVDRDLPPTIDVERQTKQSAAEDDRKLAELINRLSEKYGRPPVIYTSARVYREEKLTVGANCLLWTVWYNKGQPRVPQPWIDAGKSWSIWQVGFAPGLPGISGDVDRNLACVDLKTLSLGGI